MIILKDTPGTYFTIDLSAQRGKLNGAQRPDFSSFPSVTHMTKDAGLPAFSSISTSAILTRNGLTLSQCLLCPRVNDLLPRINFLHSESTPWALFRNIMSQPLDYIRGGSRCGIDNCPSRLYAEHDDGLTYCKRGHLQVV